MSCPSHSTGCRPAGYGEHWTSSKVSYGIEFSLCLLVYVGCGKGPSIGCIYLGPCFFLLLFILYIAAHDLGADLRRREGWGAFTSDVIPGFFKSFIAFIRRHREAEKMSGVEECYQRQSYEYKRMSG